MPGTTRKTLLYPFYFLAHPALMFVVLPWLMLLLVLGTVAQRYIGLYASQKIFFGSFLLWVGYIPLPGAYATLALVAFSLFAKLALKSPLRRSQAGTVLIHVSALVLFAGGLITALSREEGYLVLADGESTQVVSDYQQRNFTVLKDKNPAATMAYARLHPGDDYAPPGVPFTLKIVRTCFPCTVARAVRPPNNARGMAQSVALADAPYTKDDTRNMRGLEVEVHGAGAGQDGTYIVLETVSSSDAIAVGTSRYSLAVLPVERQLPFSVHLSHFAKADYPGTDEPQSYRSDVEVRDGGLAWSAAIEMNQPLRYRGYTFYQSSYVEENGKLASVLAVVKNAGGWFPYISISMLCAGLVLHLVMMLLDRRP